MTAPLLPLEDLDKAMHMYALDSALRPVRVSEETYCAWHRGMPNRAAWYSEKTGWGFVLGQSTPIGCPPFTVVVYTVYFPIHILIQEDAPLKLWSTLVLAQEGGMPELAKTYPASRTHYTSHEAAVQGHADVVRMVFSEGLEALTGGMPCCGK